MIPVLTREMLRAYVQYVAATEGEQGYVCRSDHPAHTLEAMAAQHVTGTGMHSDAQHTFLSREDAEWVIPIAPDASEICQAVYLLEGDVTVKDVVFLL